MTKDAKFMMKSSITQIKYGVFYSCLAVCMEPYVECILYVQRVTEKQNKVVITDRMWARLLASTNQPSFLDHKDVFGDEKEGAPKNQPINGNNYLQATTTTLGGPNDVAEDKKQLETPMLSINGNE